MDTLTPAPAPEPAPSTTRSPWHVSWLIIPLLVLLVATVSIFYVIYSTAYIDGISMEPTLLSSDLVLHTRGYDILSRGDIVVIRTKDADAPDAASGIVKRIIALEGDEIEVVSGQAYVNGQPENGSHTVYVADSDISVPLQCVPAGHVFVLGDNRPISEDSRIFGPVSLDRILGKVVIIIAPMDRMKLID